MIALTNSTDEDKPIWPKVEVGIRGTHETRFLLGSFQSGLAACEIMN